MSGFAWVTLATNDSYSLGALVLAHSLKQVGTKHQLVVLVTPGVTNAMREKLTAVFNLVEEVNPLDSKDEANLKLLKRPELGITFTKLHCWRLIQFQKCVFLDADTLVLSNSDELFDREEFSAAPDVGWPDCFNSGVFVYKPSNETYSKLVDFALLKGSFDGGDQGLLNLYFSDWAHKDIAKHLPFIYNMCSTAVYSYLPAFKQYGKNAKIVHFIGPAKPWLQYFNTETLKVYPSPGLQHLEEILQKWWNIFCSLIHPNLTADMAGSKQSTEHVPSLRVDPFPTQNIHQIPEEEINHDVHSSNIWDPWEEYDSNQVLELPIHYVGNPGNDRCSNKDVSQNRITNNDVASNFSHIDDKTEDYARRTNVVRENPERAAISNSISDNRSSRETDNLIEYRSEPIGTSEIRSRELLTDPEIPSSDPLTPETPIVCTPPRTVSQELASLHTNYKNDADVSGDSGLAGAFAQLILGAKRTESQDALENHLRRQAWEVGNIDYLGRDSFDHIWSKICESLSAPAVESGAQSTGDDKAEKAPEVIGGPVRPKGEVIPVPLTRPDVIPPKTETVPPTVEELKPTEISTDVPHDTPKPPETSAAPPVVSQEKPADQVCQAPIIATEPPIPVEAPKTASPTKEGEEPLESKATKTPDVPIEKSEKPQSPKPESESTELQEVEGELKIEEPKPDVLPAAQVETSESEKVGEIVSTVVTPPTPTDSTIVTTPVKEDVPKSSEQSTEPVAVAKEEKVTEAIPDVIPKVESSEPIEASPVSEKDEECPAKKEGESQLKKDEPCPVKTEEAKSEPIPSSAEAVKPLTEIQTAGAEIPHAESEAPKAEVPKVETEVPKVESETPKLEMEATKVEPEKVKEKSEIPKTEAETPKVEKEVSKLEAETPKVEDEKPKPESEVPKVETEIPKTQEVTPKVEAETPKTQAETPKLEVEKTKPDVPTPKPEGEMPKVEPEAPKVATEMPKTEVEPPQETPKVEAEISKVEIQAPKVESDATKAEIQAPKSSETTEEKTEGAKAEPAEGTQDKPKKKVVKKVKKVPKTESGVPKTESSASEEQPEAVGGEASMPTPPPRKTTTVKKVKAKKP